jgi:DNA-binding NarL/FixJ family response regulator
MKIMNKESQSNIVLDYLKNNTSIEVVGSLLLNSSQYLIVDDNLNENLSHSRVGNLDIGGRTYYIVKTRNSAKIDELNLANLLTGRELQITTLAALGRSNKQIAHHLQISDCTVSAHLRRIFIKLNVENRAAMVYRCAALIDRLQHLDDRFSQTN